MTTRSRMQCLVCAHYRSPLDSDDDDAPEQTCDAFPDRIPDQIWGMQFDHRQPFPGDHGIQWESQGRPYPAEDLVPPTDLPVAPPVAAMRADALIGWDPVQELCMPPKVPVPKPGPCPGTKRGAKSAVTSTVKKVAKPRKLTFPEAYRQLSAVYGSRIHISGSQKSPTKHVKEQVVALAKVPREMHERVMRHFEKSKGALAGIFIGNGPVTKVSPLGDYLKGQQPRGWAKGRTFNEVAGVFIPAFSQMVVGGGPRVPHGSQVLSAHEFGHALDETGYSAATPYRYSARRPWIEAVTTIVNDRNLIGHPYYTPDGNAQGWLSESFAEALGAWSEVEDKDEDTKARAILKALTRVNPMVKPGMEYSRDVLVAAKSMVAQFDYLAGR